MPANWPLYTWDPRARQYRDARGRFVPRTAVRQALSEFVDAAAVRIEVDARLLQAGRINLSEWQLRMEANLKAIHTASAAIAAGGWAQATARDWSAAAVRLKKQYAFLRRFARQIEQGLPLDGRFLVRAASYAVAGDGTYERVLRGIDLASGLVIEERRIINSEHPCASCITYRALGWQAPGVLPDTGEDCLCGMRCRCTFERHMLDLARLRFKPSPRGGGGDYTTVWVDVEQLDRGFQRDKGFYIGAKGAGAIPGRQAGFRQFLSDVDKHAIEQPEVVVDPDGTVSFVNGRHRFSVLRDLGIKEIPVSVAAGGVETARRLFGAR